MGCQGLFQPVRQSFCLTLRLKDTFSEGGILGAEGCRCRFCTGGSAARWAPVHLVDLPRAEKRNACTLTPQSRGVTGCVLEHYCDRPRHPDPGSNLVCGKLAALLERSSQPEALLHAIEGLIGLF